MIQNYNFYPFRTANKLYADTLPSKVFTCNIIGLTVVLRDSKPLLVRATLT